MYYNIFKRVEEKYLITAEEKELLLKEIGSYLQKDAYFQTTICNIYYDNQNQDLIIRSLEKPAFKNKIRLRSYGVPTLQDKVFLEIKNKYKGIVEKRRIRMSLSDFYSYRNDGVLFYDEQIMRELDYYFQYYQLEPAYFIAYDRTSYRGVDDANLRITFDHNLRSRRDRLRLDAGDDGVKYFEEDMSIMEIKTLDSMPLWLVQSLSKLKIYPTSFSKLGKIYEKEFQENKKEIGKMEGEVL